MRVNKEKEGMFMRYSKKILAAIVATALIVGAIPQAAITTQAATKKAKALKLNKTSLEMYVGEKQTLKVTKVTPAKASKAVTWTTSNKKVVTVSSKGKITAKKTGSAKVTAVSKSNSNVKVICKINVYNKPKSFKLNKTKYSINVGDSFKLKVQSAAPKNAYKKVKFSSTNSSVAKVDSDGEVYAKSSGTASIKVQSVWNSKVTASCIVTVKKKESVTTVPTVKPSIIPSITATPTKTPELTETPKPTIKTERVLLSGFYEDTSWTIDENGLLEITGTGDMYNYIEHENRFFVGWTMKTAWGEYKDIIKSVKVNVTDVTQLKKMFWGCENLEYVDLSGLKTEKVTDMSYMFANCKKLKKIVWGNFNTENVTKMNCMFYGCDSLETIDLSRFHTQNVTDMGKMFFGCDKLETLDLSGFNTKSVTNMQGMFSNCYNLEEINLSNFDTKNVTDMQYMFCLNKRLKTIDLTNIDTKNVTNMSYMFSDCSGLEAINLSNFDVNNVTNMSCMFSGCSGLEVINLSNFNVKNVTNMSFMFDGCNSLETIDLSNFNMENVTSMNYMFRSCDSLKKIDLKDVSFGNLKEASYMLKGCKNLQTIVTPKGTMQVTILLPEGVWKDDNGNFYSAIPKECAESITLKPLERAELEPIEGNIAKSGAYGQITWTLDSNGKLEIKGMGNVCEEGEYPGWLDVRTGSYNEKYVVKNYDIKEAKIDINYATDLSSLFKYCENLEKVDLTGVDMSTVESTRSMFDGCSNLTSVSFGKYKESSLKYIDSMFNECKKIEIIDMGEIACKIEGFSGFCDNCTNLKEINLKNMDFSQVSGNLGWNCTNLEKMITPCITGTEGFSICIGTWTDEKGNEYNSIPNNQQKSITLTRRKTHSGTYENTTWSIDEKGLLMVTGTGNMYQTYQEYDDDDYDDWEDYEAEKEKNYPEWRKYSDDIVSAVINVQGATNAYGLFDNCKYLKNVDLSGLQTECITNMGSMFAGCSELKTIDLSEFNTENVINMREMFDNCSSLETIDLSCFDMGKVTDAEDMLDACSSLTCIKTPNILGNIEIELWAFTEKWKDTNGTVYSYLPSNMQYSIVLTRKEDVSDIVQLTITPTPVVSTTPKPTITPVPTKEDIIYSGSYGQTSWTISKEGLLEVSGEGDIYQEVGRGITIGSISYEDEYGYTLRPQWTWYSDFIQAAKLDVKNAHAGAQLFYNCDKLKFLDLSGFSAQEYSFCIKPHLSLSKLKGLETIITPESIWKIKVKLPIGVWLDSNNNRYYYFPEESKTLKLQAKVLETGNYRDTEWFVDESGLFELEGKGNYYSGAKRRGGNVPNWHGISAKKAVVDLKEVVDASKMFQGLYNLTEIDITKLDLEKAETMAYMFDECRKLEQLDLSMLNTENVENMEGLFYECSSLKQVDLSSFDTGNVTNMDNMFYGCDNLKVIKTPCDSGKVTTELPDGIWQDEEGNTYTELPANAEKSIVLTKVGELEVDEGDIASNDEVTLSTPVMPK